MPHRAGNWEDAFCYWAGVLYAAKNEPHWYGDSDVPEVVLAIYKHFVKDWKKLRKMSDEELGGLVTEVGAGESVKQQLQWYMQDLVEDMRGADYDEVPDVPKL